MSAEPTVCRRMLHERVGARGENQRRGGSRPRPEHEVAVTPPGTGGCALRMRWRPSTATCSSATSPPSSPRAFVTHLGTTSTPARCLGRRCSSCHHAHDRYRARPPCSNSTRGGGHRGDKRTPGRAREDGIGVGVAWTMKARAPGLCTRGRPWLQRRRPEPSPPSPIPANAVCRRAPRFDRDHSLRSNSGVI
ncbi:hypothetical protein SEVIR_8G172788v4 [Setaria viridis]